MCIVCFLVQRSYSYNENERERSLCAHTNIIIIKK